MDQGTPGMIRYKQLLGFAKAGRAKSATEVLEKATLKLVRANVGMTEEVGDADDAPALLFKKSTKNADVDTWDFEESDASVAEDDATIGNSDDDSDNDSGHGSKSGAQIDLGSVSRSAGV